MDGRRQAAQLEIHEEVISGRHQNSPFEIEASRRSFYSFLVFFKAVDSNHEETYTTHLFADRHVC
jgi:hypothetical protein